MIWGYSRRDDRENIRGVSPENHKSQIINHRFCQPMATLMALLLLSLFAVMYFMFAS
jgi:hypothetical protein